MYDYGWEPGTSSIDVTISGVTTTYTFPDGVYEAAYAIGVNTEGCEVTIPIYGCTDPEAMNYNAEANTGRWLLPLPLRVRRCVRTRLRLRLLHG